MSRKDTEHQRKSMSRIYRGTQIFKPLNTGRIDDHVACVREWVANIFFYTKDNVTIMIDAGYNYERLKEKMGWLDIDPDSIHHILITHQDTDHVGALEPDSEQLFKDATVYLSEIENKYITGEKRRKVIHGLYKLPMVKMNNERRLLKDGQVLDIEGIWSTWWMTNTCSPGIPSGSVRTAATALLPCLRKATSCLFKALRNWRQTCESGNGRSL